MIGIIITSEDKESSEMLKTVKRLVGDAPGVSAVSLTQKLDPEGMTKRLRTVIEKMGPLEGVIILTDLVGSTQCRICQRFLKKGSIELVAGYNLPLVVKLSTINQKSSLKEIVNIASEYGQKYIIHQSGTSSIPDIPLKNILP